MDKLEKLISEIMAEAEADGEPITKEEAEEMAKWELSAKDIKRYEQKDLKEKTPRKQKERKIDETKVEILKKLSIVIEGMQLNNGEDKNTTIRGDADFSFSYGGVNYTVKLVKHRPKK